VGAGGSREGSELQRQEQPSRRGSSRLTHPPAPQAEGVGAGGSREGSELQRQEQPSRRVSSRLTHPPAPQAEGVGAGRGPSTHLSRSRVKEDGGVYQDEAKESPSGPPPKEQQVCSGVDTGEGRSTGRPHPAGETVPWQICERPGRAWTADSTRWAVCLASQRRSQEGRGAGRWGKNRVAVAQGECAGEPETAREEVQKAEVESSQQALTEDLPLPQDTPRGCPEPLARRELPPEPLGRQ